MNYASIKSHDVANGPGVRVSVFVSGCEHRCPGCFNPETWDFNYGSPFGVGQIADILSLGGADYIKGLSILGGEPLHPSNRISVLALCNAWKRHYPNKSIWLYTGYVVEDVPEGGGILKYIDVLVDGPFIEAEKDLSLRFRGSRNQRIIDVKKSQQAGEVVLWNEEENE